MAVVSTGSLGDTLYAYVGQYAGLPLIMNRGVLGIEANGASFPVPLLRPTVAGNLLIACMFQFSGAALTATLGAGWSSYTSYTGNLPFLFVATKVADGSEGTSVSPWTNFTGVPGGQPYNGYIIYVVEIQNYYATTPISSFHYTSTANLTGLASNNLLIVFSYTNGYFDSPPRMNGLIPLGSHELIQNYGMTYGYAWPLIKEILGTTFTQGRLWQSTQNWVNGNFIIVLNANGTTSVNFWRPIG